MLATSVRVRPCSARSSPRSVGRATVICPSICSTFIRTGNSRWSSPSGPLTVTRPGEIETDTPPGTSIGFFPIRLMSFRSAKTVAVVSLTFSAVPLVHPVRSPTVLIFRQGKSPDEAHDFAADTPLLRRAARDEAARGGEDRHSHPAEHAREAILARIHPAAGLGDPLQVGDDPLPAAPVLQLDHEGIEAFPLLDVEFRDVALLLEDAGDLLL